MVIHKASFCMQKCAKLEVISHLWYNTYDFVHISDH